ncbi:uncharacterized protein LOC108137061 [Drosophila elegans]|uniref:uncharacterized protein LOC108137061 n=1 Tax=Drosophila elegans TaxID=30023 RepID=UPI0007E87013|nr:uncharacterized protein LOC108137061 [Drosophila elegans]
MTTKGFIIFAMVLIASIGAQPVTHAGMEMEMEVDAMVTTRRPNLVIQGMDDESMRYHFVTEHRPTSLGQNYYLKPGQIVGAVNLESDVLEVRHDQDDGKPVASKHNILFVAYAKDLEHKTKP